MERIKNNWPIKLTSIIFAFALWYYVVSDANPEITKEFRNVEVNIVGIETLTDLGKDIVYPTEPKVHVKVKGSRDVISKLKDSEIEATVDLNSIKEDLKNGIHEKRVEVNYSFPTGVIKEDETDKFLDFKFDNVISSEYDIEVEQIGNLPSSNLAIRDIEVVPNVVTITGQEKSMNKIDKVVVLVDVSAETKDVTKNIKIQAYDKNEEEVENLDFSEQNAKVNIYISNSKQVPIKITTINDLPEGIEITSNKLSKEKVTIIGEEKLLDKISEIETEPIDLSKINNNMTIDARLILPEGIDLMLQEDITIEIIVKPKEGEESNLVNKTFIIKKERIEILNNIRDYNVIYASDVSDIGVTLEGTEEAVNKIKEDDIKLSVDVEGLWRGRHEVSVNINNIKGLTTTVKPANVEIELK
ncbi:hypothetical protein LJC13_00570 [Peptostreptococcaceae bacterium OttesenSCG-928-C18]|nr:hypothetical protein [Peptostreptococcaceae bacterium OttesenSCG-928-C18]